MSDYTDSETNFSIDSEYSEYKQASSDSDTDNDTETDSETVSELTKLNTNGHNNADTTCKCPNLIINSEFIEVFELASLLDRFIINKNKTIQNEFIGFLFGTAHKPVTKCDLSNKTVKALVIPNSYLHLPFNIVDVAKDLRKYVRNLFKCNSTYELIGWICFTDSEKNEPKPEHVIAHYIIQQEINSKSIFILMDSSSYQFYCLNYEKYKDDNDLQYGKLNYDAVFRKVNSIQKYVHSFNTVQINDKIAKSRIYYAYDSKSDIMNTKNFIKKSKKLLNIEDSE